MIVELEKDLNAAKLQLKKIARLKNKIRENEDDGLVLRLLGEG